MSLTLAQQSLRLLNWLQHQAIPLWSERGLDSVSGASCERLLVDGSVDLTADIRVRVQARQAFFFSAAHVRGWCPKGADLAAGLIQFAQSRARSDADQAGYGHLLNNHYQLIDKRQDLYDHAFYLLAYAWLYRASGAGYWRRQANLLMNHLDQQFKTANGGWAEGDYRAACRRQNPHMHLLEAFLALYDATGEVPWLDRASEMVSLFQTVFFNQDKQVLFEFFKSDWTLAPGVAGETLEPGHMFEWVWLLDWYERSSGESVSDYGQALFAKARTIGIAPSGLVFDAVRPNGEILDGNKRCWGLTELIKACLVRIRAGDLAAEKLAISAMDNLFDYYLCASTPGSYIDRRGVDDSIVVDIAPASTLYHLIVLAMELEDHQQKIPDLAKLA